MIARILAVVVLMGMLFPQIFSQEAKVYTGNVKTGIGFEVPTLDMYISLFGEDSQTSSGSIYLPMVTEKFMIEPNISYRYSSNEVDIENSGYDDQEDYESSLMVNVGLFLVNYKSEKLRTYMGARVGMPHPNLRNPQRMRLREKHFFLGRRWERNTLSLNI
jgi:hypothetical protein